jgi:hypothetical protein
LILGLGIQLELPGTSANLEAVEGVAGARDLAQNPEQSGISSPIDTEVMHTDPGSSNISLGLDIYNDTNPSEHGPSP